MVFFICFCFIFFFGWGLCTPCWPETTDSAASTYLVLGLQACAHHLVLFYLSQGLILSKLAFNLLCIQEAKSDFKLLILLPLLSIPCWDDRHLSYAQLGFDTGSFTLYSTLASNSLCSWRWPYFSFLSEIRPHYIALVYLIDMWARLLDLEFLIPLPHLLYAVLGIRFSVSAMLGKLYQLSHILAPVYTFDLRQHLTELLGSIWTCSVVHAGLGFVILLPLLPKVGHTAQW